jgi:hypothetical protein
MTAPTLPTLIAISRARPTRRELGCPRCRGPVVLRAGRYVCRGCLEEFDALAELAVVEVLRG